MGVRRSDYILIGANIQVELDEEFYESEQYEKYGTSRNHKVGEIVYLPDGYSGNYFIIGVALVVDIEGYCGLGLNEFDYGTNSYENEKALVKDHVKANFDLDIEPKLIVLSHYT